MADGDGPKKFKYEIHTPDGDPINTSILLDGKPVPGVERLTLELDATKWARLNLEMASREITAHGEAVVSYLIGGECFTSDDVEMLLRSSPDRFALRVLAHRLASAMRLPVSDSETEADVAHGQ